MATNLDDPIIKRTQVIVGDPKPAAEPEKVKLPETESELEARRASILASMWGPTPPKAAAPPAEPKPDPDESAPTAGGTPPADPAAPKAETTPTGPVTPAAPPTVDAQALITETAKKIGDQVGRAIEDSRPSAPPAPVAAPEPELTPEDTRDAEIIAKMEELDPTLKGKAEAFKTFAQHRYAYESDWRAKHPGAAFNPDDPEHEEFYKRQPEIDPDAFESAKVEVLVDKKVSQRLKPVEEKAEADQRRTKADQAIAAQATTITENIKTAIRTTVTEVNAEVGAMLKDMNPIALKPEELDKLVDADPIVASVMGPIVQNELVPMLVELEKTDVEGADYALDPRNNRVHAAIAGYVEQFETDTAAKQVQRDGKTFLPLVRMTQMQNEITASKSAPDVKERRLNELFDRHWTTTVKDVKGFIVSSISQRAKAQVEQLDGLARRKYKPEAKTANAKTAAPAPQPEPVPVPATNGKPKPPAVASQATVVDTSRAGKPSEKSFGQIAVETHWGR